MTKSFPVVVIDEDAWDLGWSEGIKGKHDLHEGPFPKEHPLAHSWMSGFIEGKAEREHASREKRSVKSLLQRATSLHE